MGATARLARRTPTAGSSGTDAAASFTPVAPQPAITDVSSLTYNSMLSVPASTTFGGYSSSDEGGFCSLPSSSSGYGPASFMTPAPAPRTHASTPAATPRLVSPASSSASPHRSDDRATADAHAPTARTGAGGTVAERTDAPHSAAAGAAQRRAGGSGERRRARESPAEASQRRQRDHVLTKLAVAPTQVAKGAARIGRQPLFLAVRSRSFSAPRSLDVEFAAPQAKTGAKHPASGPVETDPAAARAAYAAGAAKGEALFDRILAAAGKIAREADTNLLRLTDRNESSLAASLARMQEDHRQRLLDTAFQRDTSLDRIAARTDTLRANVVDEANRALARMTAVRRELLDLITTLDQPVVEARSTLRTAIGVANAEGQSAREALGNLQSNLRDQFRRSGKFHSGEKVGPAIVEAMLDAAVSFAPPRITSDIKTLSDRWMTVINFAEPTAECGLCEADGKLAALHGHAQNLGVAGPRAIRAARDGALKTIDQTEQQLILTVLEAHRQTENSLAERHDQSRQMMIAQSIQATSGQRRDIEHTARQQVEALDGIAAAQPAAVAMVRHEIARAARANPARAAAVGVQAAERLQRNLSNISERHPGGVLRMAERAQAARSNASAAGARDQLGAVDGFAQQQGKFVHESFDEIRRSIEQSLVDLSQLPDQVGKSTNSMLAAARAAAATAEQEMPPKIAYIAQKLRDACDGLIPISPDSPPANPQTGHEPPPASLVCTADDQPNMSLFSPGGAAMSSPLMSSSLMSSSGPPLMSIAPTATTTPGTTSTSSSRAGDAGGPTPAATGSCAPCETARTAAHERSSAAAKAAGGNTGTNGGGGPAGGAGTGATTTTGTGTGTATGASAGDDVGVSSARTNERSPNAYRADSETIHRAAYEAPRTKGFLDQVARDVPAQISMRAANARSAISAANYASLMTALRGMNEVQGRAVSESYSFQFQRADLATDIRMHAFDGWFAGITSTAEHNRDAALSALAGHRGESAMEELEAAFNFSNETERIFAVMGSMNQSEMTTFVSAHRPRLNELLEQLSQEDQARFRAMMEGNSVRARSIELKGRIDEVNQRYPYATQSDERGFALADAFDAAEHAERWALEGPPDQADLFHLEDPAARETRERTHWANIQSDFGNLDGVADAIAQSDPAAAVSRADDPPGAALLAYAARPLEISRVYEPMQREGETREQALERQREEYARWNMQLGDERSGEYGTYRAITTSLSEYQRLQIEMSMRHGSRSDEARGARALAQFRRTDGRPPDYRDVEKSLHSGRADALEGGDFEHGSREEAERDRLRIFARAEEFRRQIEGGPTGPVSGEDARASFRREMEAAYRNRPDDLDVALGVIDSDEGNMQAVIDQAITREDPALLTRYLGRMDSRQIEDTVTEWNRRHPDGPGLRERLGLFEHHWSITNMNGAVFTGDEANSLEIAFMGVPQNTQQRAEVAHRILQQQIDEAGWLGRLLCSGEYDDLVNQARHLREVMGVRESDIDELGRIRTVDADGNVVHMNFDASGRFTPAPGQTDTGLEMLIASSRIVADSYANAVDRMAAMITTAIAIITAVVLSVVTMGAGTAIAIALVAGALTIAVNASMRGGRYSRDDLTRDVINTLVQAATAGIGAGMTNVGNAARAATIAGKSTAAFARGLGTTERVLLAATRHPIITQAALGAFSSGVTTALDPAMRRREDYGDQVLHSIFRGGIGGAVTGAVTHGITSGATAYAQRAAAGRAISGAIQRGASNEAAMDLAARAALAATRTARIEVALRTVAGATGGMLGRGAELGYENVFAGGRHTSEDFYNEMRNAFIQNAVQSFAEGVGSRFKRTSTAGGMADDAMNYRLEEAEARRIAGEAFDREMARRGIVPGATGEADRPASPSPSLTPDEATQHAVEDAAARPTRGPANDNEPIEVAPARRVGEPEEPVTPMGRRQAAAEEGEPMLRTAARPDEAEARLRSASDWEEPTRPGVEVVKPTTFEGAVDLRHGDLDGRPPILSDEVVRGTKPQDASQARLNYEVMRARTPNREVLLAFNPVTGEYVVRQGFAGSVRPMPEPFITLRHSHPRVIGGDQFSHFATILPSGIGGDFSVLRAEVDRLAGGRIGVEFRRTSVIDIEINGQRMETHFSITKQGDNYSYSVALIPPQHGVATLGPFTDIREYAYIARDMTGGGSDFGLGHNRPPSENLMTASGPEAPRRVVRGEPLSDADRTAADFIAQRMREVEIDRQTAGATPRSDVELSVAHGSAAAGTHDAVRLLGLVGQEDSLARLTNLLNDRNLSPEVRSAVAAATLEATRTELIRTGSLAPGDDVLMLFRGVSSERMADYEREGMNLARLGPGRDEDASRGLYGSQDLQSAMGYTGLEGGTVLPLIVRRSELGNVIDVRSGTPLGDRWLSFMRASQGKGRMLPGYEHLRGVLVPGVDQPIALVRDLRGARFEDFLKSVAADPTLPAAIRAAAADPHITLMDLGGVASTGNDRGILTDQWAMHSQHIADMFNAAHGFPLAGREGPSSVPGEPPILRTAAAPESSTSRRPRLMDWESQQMVNRAIASAQVSDTPEAAQLRQLMDRAPQTTGALLREIASESFAGRMRNLGDNDILAIRAEIVARGGSLDEAMVIARDIVLVAAPSAPLHQLMSEAPFSHRLQSSLREPMGYAAAERAGVRAVREFARRDSPNAERRALRRLLDLDTDGIMQILTGEGSLATRARQFAERRLHAGASWPQALAEGMLAARILESQAFRDTHERWQARAQALSHETLAEIVRTRPDVLLNLARASPQQLTEWFADYVLRQRRSIPPRIDANEFADYVQNRQRSNILPIASEASSIWSNLARMGLRLLKGDAVMRGGANRPGLDIVGFSVPPGARPMAGDLVRVAVIDDKAYRSTTLDSVSAMTGRRMSTNLRSAASEIEAGIRALVQLGEHTRNPEIAEYIWGARAAVRQMRNAARELDAIPRPAAGDLRNRAYLSRVAEALRRNNIVPVVSREYGNVRLLAQWLRSQGFMLDDEYAAILASELQRTGGVR